MDASSFAGWRSPHGRAHLHLAVSAALGIGVAALSYNAGIAARALIGWDVAVAVLLAGTARMMGTTTLPQLRRKAAQEDEAASVILTLMLVAIVASLAGIIGVVANARHARGEAAFDILLSLATLILSWVCMHTLFATHYAHAYYGDADPGEAGAGLTFPDGSVTPSYLDFVYFAFCIGMTYQVSDIMTQSRSFRRLITLQGGLSFFYNTFVLALAVNLLSGLGSGA